MNSTVRDALLSLNVPQEDIHVEYFKKKEQAASASLPAVDAQARVTLERQQFTVNIPKGKTILQALIIGLAIA